MLLRWYGDQISVSYKIEYAADPAGPWTSASQAASVGTSYLISGLTNAATYYFRVSGQDNSGAFGPASSVASQLIGVAPQGTAYDNVPMISDFNGTSVSLQWSTATAFTGLDVTFDLMMSTATLTTSATSFIRIATNLTVGSFIVDQLAPGTIYYFAVMTFNQLGYGKRSVTSDAVQVQTQESVSNLE